MKLKVDRAGLLKTLAHVQNVVERRNTVPILGNVMFDVRGDKLTMTATDMEVAIVADVPAVTSQDGSCTASAATLYDIVRKLLDGASVEFDHPGGDAQLVLRSGRHSSKLVVLPTEDFPSMTTGTLPHRFVVPAKDLLGVIDRSKFAISTEETRYYLNGIYLHPAECDGVKVLRAVATDGHRLARIDVPLPEGAGSMPGVIVPRKTVNELRKLLEKQTSNVAVALSDTRIQFKIESALLTSKLIDGTFPAYERVIPSGNDKVLRVGGKNFSEAVGRVAAISTDRTRPVKMSMSKDVLVLSAASPEQGTASEELDGDRMTYGSSPLEVGFQARYLNDITDQIDGEVEFWFSDGSAPAVVKNGTDTSALYVLMPMRV